jgi:hypothetical protein
MSRPLASLLSRATNPAILPIPARSTGNNVPKSLHKTRRTWRPNVTRSDWAIDVLHSEGAASAAESSAKGSHRAGDGLGGMIRGVKMQMRRVRDVEKAGGVEGLLVSRTATLRCGAVRFGHVRCRRVFGSAGQRQGYTSLGVEGHG